MILKKPYAFMIKHFKLIHLIMFGLCGYLAIKLNAIMRLFNTLAKNQSVSTVGLKAKYISVIMYLFILGIIVIGAFIWFLLKDKKKPRKDYVFLIVYYVLTFIFLFIMGSAMDTLEQTSMTNETLRIYRDVSLLFPLPQYYFIIIMLLRGIGFNVKQFNFSKDIKDLEVSEEDSEEIELGVSSNVYKYSRAGRRKLREFRYYFFENKFLILIILGVLLLGGLIFFFVNYKFVNNNYSQNSQVSAGKYSIKVNNTYVAINDLFGEEVKKGYKYVIVSLNVRNNYYENVKLDTRLFRLVIGNDNFYPTTSENSQFQDLGTPYDNKSLNRENEYNYILIYELPEKTSTRNLKLTVYDSIDYEKNKVNYINVNLKAKDIDYKKEEKVIELNNNSLIDEKNYGTTSLKINNYDIRNVYEYNYLSCIEKNCEDKIGVIVPSNTINNSLIILDYNFSLDENSQLFNFVKTDLDFFNKFASISYNINGKYSTRKFVGITNKNIKGKILMELPKEISEAKEIKLNIHTRSINYVFNIK